MNVWAFAKIDDDDARKLVYESIKDGKSRFGWSGEPDSDLRKKWDSKQAFLLSIRKGDWIVHVNMPQWGKCVAVRVTGEYGHDEGLQCEWGTDFRHYIPIDASSLLEFDRNDPAVLPSVNLSPRTRQHRVLAVDDFLESIENLRTKKIKLAPGESRELHHLRKDTDKVLHGLTELMHKNHKSKTLEGLLASVFRGIPGVVEVNENGYGWKSDYGADLIVTMKSSLVNLQFENRIVIQVKSFEGDHYDLSAVEQVRTALTHFEADAGMVITTAKKTRELIEAVQKLSTELDKPIDIIAGEDVARFVIENGKDLLFNLKIV